MPNFDKPLHAALPEALDAAVDSVNFTYDSSESMLQADVSLLEELNFCVFAYFNRDDVFYVNRHGRQLLDLPTSPIEPQASRPAPIFWLEENTQRNDDDVAVVQSCSPKHDVKELITLSWGKTWLQGSKYPIRSKAGVPLAILFAGREVPGSEQIRRVVTQFQKSHNEFGDN